MVKTITMYQDEFGEMHSDKDDAIIANIVHVVGGTNAPQMITVFKNLKSKPKHVCELLEQLSTYDKYGGKYPVVQFEEKASST